MRIDAKTLERDDICDLTLFKRLHGLARSAVFVLRLIGAFPRGVDFRFELAHHILILLRQLQSVFHFGRIRLDLLVEVTTRPHQPEWRGDVIVEGTSALSQLR